MELAGSYDMCDLFHMTASAIFESAQTFGSFTSGMGARLFLVKGVRCSTRSAHFLRGLGGL